MTKARDLANLGASASGGLMFRNRFINGNGAIQQRANYAFSAVGAGFAADRWYTGLTTGTSIAGVGFTSAFAGSSNGKGIYVGGSYTNGTPYFAQRIEALNTQDLNGQNVTVSGLFYQETGSAVTMVLRYVKPTVVDNYASATVIATKNITFPSGVVTPFTFTTVLGSSDATLGIQFDMYSSAPVTVSSKNFGISDMQFEKGAVATPFEWRPIGAELALCQRYYFGGTPLAGIGVASGSSLARVKASLPVTMRAIPTLTKVGSPAVYNGAVATTLTGITQNYASVDCIEFDGTIASAMTAGTCVSFYQNYDGSSITASAEI